MTFRGLGAVGVPSLIPASLSHFRAWFASDPKKSYEKKTIAKDTTASYAARRTGTIQATREAAIAAFAKSWRRE
jgi:hypothetical protein